MAKQFPPSLAPALSVKSILKSKTVLGVLVALLAKILGVGSEELSGTVEQAAIVWPVVVAVGADLLAMVKRIRRTDFDVGVLKRSEFWLVVVSALGTIAAAAGVDVAGLESVVNQGLAVFPALVSLSGSLFGLWGVVTAKKAVVVVG